MQLHKSYMAMLFLASSVAADSDAYGTCQAGCSSLVVACYAAAGFTFGTLAAAGAPGAILRCNDSYGDCQAACARAT